MGFDAQPECDAGLHRLDAHRKRQQQLHPSLTLTEMYNVLEKLRALSPAITPTPDPTALAADTPSANGARHTSPEEPASEIGRDFSPGKTAAISKGALAPGTRPPALPARVQPFSSPSEGPTHNPAPVSALATPTHPEPPSFTEHELAIYAAGLIGTLRELHDSLDRAVFDAYGWPHALTTEQILERIVALNAERRAEEASGLIRWLRLDYQAPNYVPAAARRKQPWPAAIPDQFRVIKDAMRSAAPQSPQQIATGFRPAPRTRVAEILATLTALGQARESAGRYSL